MMKSRVAARHGQDQKVAVGQAAGHLVRTGAAEVRQDKPAQPARRRRRGTARRLLDAEDHRGVPGKRRGLRGSSRRGAGVTRSPSATGRLQACDRMVDQQALDLAGALDGLTARKVCCMPARALFHTAPRCVEIREVGTPQPAAGELLVRTLCSGISGGTERLVYRGEVPAELALDDTIGALGGTFSYPFAYGYACVGEEAESGQAVFAFHPHQDIFAARAGELIPLPGIDPASATLLPLVETALQVTLDAGTGYRDRVIVLGADRKSACRERV